MSQFLTYTILGLTTAGVLAVAASGLVVTYQTSGIFNFAHGAVGMLSAFLYWQLTFEWEVPALLSLLIVLGVFAPLLGAATERFIMRGLVGTREVTRIVVPVSLLVFLLGVATWLWPPQGRPFDAFFQGDKVQIGDVFVTYHQIITVVCAIVVAVGLRILLHRSRAGITMRAVVDDRDLVQLNAGDPNRSAMISWMIGSQLAALAGILVAPAVRLTAVGLTLLVVNAYAAAVVGRLKSLPMTFLGAAILGLLDAYAAGYLPGDNPYLSSFRGAIPSLFLFVALLLVPHARLRGATLQRVREASTSTTVKAAAVGGLILVVVTFWVTGFLDVSQQIDLGQALGIGVIALSLIPLVGYAGQTSLCQMTFAAIGAMMMAQFGSGGSLWGLVVAVVVTAGVGALVALPAIRLQGLYLALVTAAFAVVFDQWVFKLTGADPFGFHLDLFGGGTLVVPKLDLPGLDTGSERSATVMLAVVFAVFGVGVVAIRRSRFGRRLIALRTSPAASATLGVRVTRTRFAVFALSAGMAGLGGALFAGVQGGVSAEQFNVVQSSVLLLLTVAGGVSLVSGALFAGLTGVLFKWLGDEFSFFENAALLLPGVLGIVLGRQPDGAVHQIAEGFRPLRRNLPMLVGAGAVAAGGLTLRSMGVISSWTLIGVVVVGFVAGNILAERRLGRSTSSDVDPDESTRTPTPERMGLDEDWTEDQVRSLDRVLGVEA